MSLRSTGCTAAGEPPDAALFEPPHAARMVASATAPPTAKNARCLDPCINRFSSLNWYFAANSTGSPLDEPFFDGADHPLRDEREDCEQEHAGKHAVDVEGVPGVVDELAEAARRSEEFADDGADDRQPETDMQAGQNPRERRRDDDLGRQPSIVSAEDARVGDQVAVDLAHALEGIEEDHEENEHHGGPRLAPDGNDPEHDREERTEHHPRDRVCRPDEGGKHLGE